MKKASEHDEQAALIKWFDTAYSLYKGRLAATPNGGKRHIRTAVSLKAEGVRAGYPDLFLPVPRNNHHGLHIELKVKKGRLSDSQKDWLNFLNSQGYMAVCCYGWDEARAVIIDYLRG